MSFFLSCRACCADPVGDGQEIRVAAVTEGVPPRAGIKPSGQTPRPKPNTNDLYKGITGMKHVKVDDGKPELKHKMDSDEQMIVKNLEGIYEKARGDLATLSKNCKMDLGLLKKTPPKNKADFARGALVGQWNEVTPRVELEKRAAAAAKGKK